jgi:hypothetical protein
MPEVIVIELPLAVAPILLVAHLLVWSFSSMSRCWRNKS